MSHSALLSGGPHTDLPPGPLLDPEPWVIGYLAGGVRGQPQTPQPVVSPQALARVERAAYVARLHQLQHRVAAVERRQAITVERYERILAHRTASFRSWVEQDDPRPDEFHWIGRSTETTSGSGGKSGDSTAVATDGGHDRRSITGRLVRRLTTILGIARR